MSNSSTLHVADPDGVWYLNTGSFRIHDPESGTIFEPQVRTQATETAWARSQPTLSRSAPTRSSHTLAEDESAEDVQAAALALKEASEKTDKHHKK